MDITALLTDFAFSKYESSCYLSLLSRHPANGSQISKLSGIARSRIYDVLRSLTRKGVVFEVDKGMYVPLPFEELKKRLKRQFDANLSLLETQIREKAAETSTEYLLTLKGRDTVLQKAEDILAHAENELYLRLFPKTWRRLKKPLTAAAARGVGIRFIAMGDIPLTCDIQIIHPRYHDLEGKIGGESMDIIADKSEALGGIFETGIEDQSPIIWTRNRSFVTTNRDSLRHDFYHYFFYKTYEENKPLTSREKRMYEFIKQDD